MTPDKHIPAPPRGKGGARIKYGFDSLVETNDSLFHADVEARTVRNAAGYYVRTRYTGLKARDYFRVAEVEGGVRLWLLKPLPTNQTKKDNT